jgi:4-azaleucine resistance transporter AzlC
MGSGYRAGGRAALPLAVVLIGFGISYGVLARSAGMGILAPVVMSATTFAGSAQFAAASILGTGGGAVAAVVAAALLNSRYVPIGLSVAPVSTGPFWRRLLRAQLVIDESWAIGNMGAGRFDLERIVGAGAVLYAAWVTSTAVGVVAGDLVGDPARLGLDAAFPALFLGLLAPQLGDRRALAAAGLGASIALLLVPFSAAGIPVIAASAACLIGARHR